MKLLCFFGFHKWEFVVKPSFEEAFIEQVINGTAYLWTGLQCQRCGKIKGAGG